MCSQKRVRKKDGSCNVFGDARKLLKISITTAVTIIIIIKCNIYPQRPTFQNTALLLSVWG